MNVTHWQEKKMTSSAAEDLECLTKTERRIFETLSDDLPHTRQELHRCLDDNLSDPTAVRKHITSLRKKLSARGYLIHCVLGFGRKLSYRMSRRLRQSHE